MQGTDRLVEGKLVRRKRLELWAKMGSPCAEHLFWNCIGVQEGARSQQVGSSRTALFDLLKGERPGGRDGGRMVSDQPSTPGQQGSSLLAIQSQVALDTV